MSTFNERYQICCLEICGSVGHTSTKTAALAWAKKHATIESCKNAYVFDRMAHKGSADCFYPNGKIKSRK